MPQTRTPYLQDEFSGERKMQLDGHMQMSGGRGASEIWARQAVYPGGLPRGWGESRGVSALRLATPIAQIFLPRISFYLCTNMSTLSLILFASKYFRYIFRRRNEYFSISFSHLQQLKNEKWMSSSFQDISHNFGQNCFFFKTCGFSAKFLKFLKKRKNSCFVSFLNGSRYSYNAPRMCLKCYCQ